MTAGRPDPRAVYCPECAAAPGNSCTGSRGPLQREHKPRRELAKVPGLIAMHDASGAFCGFVHFSPKGAPSSPQTPHQPLPLKGGEEDNNKETPTPFAELAWAAWLELRRPERTTLTVGTERQLRRAGEAGFTLDQVRTMMRALLDSDWHRERGLLTLSTIFATKPGGPTFEDQLQTWLQRGADTASSPAAGNSTVVDDLIAAAKNTIRQTWGRDSKAAAELRDGAVEALARYGIKVCSHTNGQPLFSRV